MRSLLGLIWLTAALAACSLKTNSFTPDPGSSAGPGSDAGPAATCSDQVKNGSETDVDCGGSCGPCAIGQQCASIADCVAGTCQDMACRAPSCSDGIRNGDEIATDCGGSCGRCGDGEVCGTAADCRSGVCANGTCQVATCSDDLQNGAETGIDCGGGCTGCGLGGPCMVDGDCGAPGICRAGLCSVALSCAELKDHGAADGIAVYTIAPAGVSFDAVCDMATDGGGWTLLLKAMGDVTLGYDASAWIDDSLVNPTDLTTSAGNAKYQSFMDLPVTTLTGELDGFRFARAVDSLTAHQVFSGGPAYSTDPAVFDATFKVTNEPNWSTQPNCHLYGFNTDQGFGRTRFGWSANQEPAPDCTSNDTGIGLGIKNTNDGTARGAGYQCRSSLCLCRAPECVDTLVNSPGNGLLWGR